MYSEDQKHFRLKDVAKFITPNSNVDNLLTKHQIAQKHPIDMDKTCQHYHHNKNITCQQRARTRVSMTMTSLTSIRSTSNQQEKEEEQLSQQCPS